MAAGLFGYTIRRLLWAIPVIFVISFAVFFTLRIVPGDPTDTLLGNRYDPDVAAHLKAKYGYDKPIPVQYVKYIGNLVQGDLGVSTKHQDFTVKEVIVPKIWVSTRIAFMAVIISFGIGIPVGIYAAMARGTFLDPLVIGSWLALDAVPEIVLVPICQWFFSYKLGLFQLSWHGVGSPNIILPVLILGLPGVAGVARFMRASVLTVIGEDYVRTARAKGLKESTVVMTHITRNAMLPMLTVIGLTLPGLATGSLFVESLFGIPGIGAESLGAALAPDFDVLMALTLFASTLFVLANIMVDVLYAVIDPRIRVGAARG